MGLMENTVVSAQKVGIQATWDGWGHVWDSQLLTLSRWHFLWCFAPCPGTKIVKVRGSFGPRSWHRTRIWFMAGKSQSQCGLLISLFIHLCCTRPYVEGLKKRNSVSLKKFPRPSLRVLWHHSMSCARGVSPDSLSLRTDIAQWGQVRDASKKVLFANAHVSGDNRVARDTQWQVSKQDQSLVEL